MSLIFDGFVDRKDAEAFQHAVNDGYPDRATRIWTDQDGMEELFHRQLSGNATQEEMEIEADMFPWQLNAPIVLVGRSDSFREEREIETLVAKFGGTFAGT